MAVPVAVDGASIQGNVSPEIKRLLALSSNKGMGGSKYTGFCASIAERLKLTEASIISKVEEPAKLEARVVYELDVGRDMLNRSGDIHGGCSAWLVDRCSTIAIVVYSLHTTGVPHLGVSQSLNIVYHSPATLGDKLRIVNTTLTAGARVVSARTEIWNATRHRLVVSGTHVKMQPSKTKGPKL